MRWCASGFRVEGFWGVVSQKVSDCCINSYEYGGSGWGGLLQGFGLRALGTFVLGPAGYLYPNRKSRTQPPQDQLCTPWKAVS